MKLLAEIDKQRCLMIATAAHYGATVVGNRYLTFKIFHKYFRILYELTGRIRHPYNAGRLYRRALYFTGGCVRL